MTIQCPSDHLHTIRIQLELSRQSYYCHLLLLSLWLWLLLLLVVGLKCPQNTGRRRRRLPHTTTIWLDSDCTFFILIRIIHCCYSSSVAGSCSI